MSSRCWPVLFALLGLVSEARGDEPASATSQTSPHILDLAREAEFTGWVHEGDEARKAGRPGLAANAYSRALEIHDDPVVAGRLGVLLVQLKKPAEAVDLLLSGIERGFLNVDKEERRLFVESYENARAQVTWLNVTISQAGASVTVDGQPRNREKFSAFAIFVMPGEHELRATLPGYKDAVISFTGKAGGELSVNVLLVPLPGTPVEAPKNLLRRRRLDREEGSAAVRDLDLPPDDEPEKKAIYGGVEGAERPDKPRVAVSAGPVVVFGVASWQPAVGAVAGVAWRPREYFSLGIEGRGAWLTSGVADRPISAMTAGGIASACGHWRWLFGCGLGHLGVVGIAFSDASYAEKSTTAFMPGGGVRVGASFRLGNSFMLQGALGGLVLARGIRVVAGQTTLVHQGPWMFDGQVVGGWEF